MRAWLRIFGLIGVAFAAWAGAFWYTVDENPEIRFWRKAYEVKTARSAALSQSGKPKYVFAGGSSCAFQIDTKILENEFGIASVNMGFHAGTGAGVVAAVAMAECRPGDTLVLMIEPGLLTEDLAIPQLGYQALEIFVKPEASKVLVDLGIYHEADALMALRPGLYTVATMIGKWVLGKKDYRYNVQDIQSGGMITTPEKRQLLSNSGYSRVVLPKRSLEFLAGIVEMMKKRDVKVICILPWRYGEGPDAVAARRGNEDYLDAVRPIMPVLDDGRLGLLEDAGAFADTSLHMTETAAADRTRGLGGLLSRLSSGRNDVKPTLP